jgi:ribonuclease HIII
MAGEARWRELKRFVESKGWRWQPGKPIQHGEQINITAGGNHATVNFYPKRGKIVVGGPASHLQDALKAWLRGDTLETGQSLDDRSDSGSGPSTRLDALKAFIREQGWNWGPGAALQHGEQIVVSAAGVTAVVNFWPKRGKMVVQGADSLLKAALEDWIASGTAVPDTAPSFQGPHIGMDESGKGDWFGPLVVAAVYLEDAQAAALRRQGVQDSKNLSDESIQRLAGQIERLIPADQRHVQAVELETYNRLYEQYGNINQLLAEIYGQVARQAYLATQAETIVCDQFSQKEERLASAFARHELPEPIQRHRAETLSTAVAAASILASATFTDELAQMGQEAGLGMSLPKGASDIEALEGAAQHIIVTQGPEALVQYAKLHFKPIRKLLGENGHLEIQPDNQAQAGPPVSIRQDAWLVQYHPSGFWRYRFQDGGFLDWWEDSEKGTIYVHGKADAKSVRVLKPVTDGKCWKGEREAVDKSVGRHIPRLVKKSVPSVLGIGWHRQDTVFGARFNFTDGGILNYYRSKDELKNTLVIQGTPSPLTAEALKALPTPFWAGVDELTDTLKRLFPDWRLGDSQQKDDETDVGIVAEWESLQGALNWQAFWPEGKEIREAANQTSPCQRAMIEDWASVLTHHRGKRHMLAHAPTGLGKTLAALSPALAWVAEAPDQRRIYYLVNRVMQHRNPLRELEEELANHFEEKTGQPLRVVDLVGRGHLCLHPRANTLPDSCRDARDGASFDLLSDGVSSWQEVKDHLPGDICPYHTLQGLMSQAHVVICDYWWLFSPQAQESGLAERAGFSPEDSIVVVDEAHNLVSRVRSWLDVDEPTDRVSWAVQRAPATVQHCLAPVLETLDTADFDVGLSPSGLLSQAGGAEIVRAALADLVKDESVESFATVSERMLRLLLYPDEAVVIYPVEDYQTGDRRLVFRLIDPTALLAEGYGHVHASLNMSGSLAAPADGDRELFYQVPLFGLRLRETLTRKYASPFPLRNQRWIYCTDTLGTYRRRGNYLDRYAEHIVGVGQATPGVTAVFFSSYSFLEQLKDAIEDPDEQRLIVAERRGGIDDGGGNDLVHYEEKLRGLVEDCGRAYLFAVYQGKLAEGSDFRNNLIKTAICISIPMEYPVLFHHRLEGLYTRWFAEIAEGLGDEAGAKAREYALDRLSLSLVLQACGRGIRSKCDRCAFVLLDERYHEYGWRRFLKPRPYNVRRSGKNVSDFHQQSLSAFELDWDLALISFAVRGDSK